MSEDRDLATNAGDETAANHSGGIATGGAGAAVAGLAGAHPESASFSMNVAAVAALNGSNHNFLEFNPDMPELVVQATGLGAEELAAVRVAMAQAAEELAQQHGSGLTREKQGSASSEGLGAQTRARRNWVLASGQMRSDFQSRRAQGWNRFAG